MVVLVLVQRHMNAVQTCTAVAALGWPSAKPAVTATGKSRKWECWRQQLSNKSKPSVSSSAVTIHLRLLATGVTSKVYVRPHGRCFCQTLEVAHGCKRAVCRHSCIELCACACRMHDNRQRFLRHSRIPSARCMIMYCRVQLVVCGIF
mgnify:CR=1 FL=1